MTRQHYGLEYSRESGSDPCTDLRVGPLSCGDVKQDPHIATFNGDRDDDDDDDDDDDRAIFHSPAESLRFFRK